MVNLGFWALLLLWYAGRLAAFRQHLSPTRPTTYALLLFTAGNAIAMTLSLITTRASGKPQWLLAALLIPGYWILQAIGAIKAGIQMLYDPSYWEKTRTRAWPIGTPS